MLPLVHHGMPPWYSYNLEVNNYSNSSAGKVCIFNANVKIEKVMVWKLKMQRYYIMFSLPMQIIYKISIQARIVLESTVST